MSLRDRSTQTILQQVGLPDERAKKLSVQVEYNGLVIMLFQLYYNTYVICAMVYLAEK